MPFTVINFVTAYWAHLVLGLLSLTVAKLLTDELVFRYPKGAKARLARLILHAYFALFLYGLSIYAVSVMWRIWDK